MSQHPDDDLERRLRAAFAAKAEQVGPHDLDTDREDAVAELLSRPSTPSRVRRVITGAGILAAAAAAVGVVALAIQPSQQHTTNALHPATTSSTSAVLSIAPPQPTTSAGPAKETPHVGQATPGRQVSTRSQPLTTTTTPTTTSTTTTQPRVATTHSAPASSVTQTSPRTTLSTGHEYAGPVPLGDARTLAMPQDLTWEVTTRTEHSMTVRITYLPQDIEAYWATTLPGDGWQKSDAGGWLVPGSAYAVSPITDKGSLTVTW